MANNGVQPHIIEAVLNHVSGHKAGVADIYNRATYATEKAAALTLWADHLRTIIKGGVRKVPPLRSRIADSGIKYRTKWPNRARTVSSMGQQNA